MDIGIITYWRTEENYGQVMQIFALQFVLKKLGHNPFFLMYVQGSLPPYVEHRIKKAMGGLSISRIVEFLKHRIEKNPQISPVVKRNFQCFKNRYINQTLQTFTPQQLYQNPPKADCYICGSDQIWNYPNPVYLLDWCPDNLPRYSYAVSFGRTHVPKHLRCVYSQYLKRFSAISTRELSGINLCRDLGYNGLIVHSLDPTLLLTSDEYYKAIDIVKARYEKPYLLLYLLGNRTQIDTNDIYRIAETKGLDVVFVPSQGCSFECDRPPMYPSIEEMLGLIDGASFVVTNSFHGTVFSIIFNKQFVTIPLSGDDVRMNERLLSLFDSLDIKEHFLSKDFDVVNNIDYTVINSRLADLRRVSESYLQMIDAHKTT